MGEYESIIESSTVQIFNSDFQNSVQFLIGELIGSIAANYSVEFALLLCLSLVLIENEKFFFRMNTNI